MDDLLFYEETEEEIKVHEEQRKLSMDNVDRLVSDLVREIRCGKIILDPDYQRNYVWANAQSSKLVESIILNIPIPNIYLAETVDGKWEVIDGVQRLTTLLKYYDNEIKLTNLEVLAELNGNRYNELDDKIRNFLDDRSIRCVRIKKDSSNDIKFDVFMRLNQGSTKLNEQELRNCLYRGTFNDELKRISNDKLFLELLGTSERSTVIKRMKHCELSLRFIVFNSLIDVEKNQISNYGGRIKNSLNIFMKENIDAGDSYNNELKDAFIYLTKVKEEHGFIPFRLKGDNAINLSLSETQLIFALYCSKNNIEHKRYYDAFLTLIQLEQFIDLCKNATGNTTRVLERYGLVYEELCAN